MIFRRRPFVADLSAFRLRIEPKVSPSTLKLYMREVELFTGFAGRKPRKGYAKAQVEAWLDTRKIAPSTFQRALSALKVYFKFLGQPLVTDEIDAPQRAKLLPQPVEGLPFLLKKMEDEGERDLAWTCIFIASTGLRISEACGGGGRGFVLIDGGERIRVHGKGSKDRVLPLSESAKTALAMLTPPHGEPRIPWTVKQLQAATRPYGFHPHQLRHTFASDLYNKTQDIRLVAFALGHASSTTAEGYAQLDTKRLDAAMGNGKVEA